MANNTDKRTVEIILNGQKVNASMKEMDAAAAVLNAQLRKLPMGTKEFIEKTKELQQVRERIKDVKQEVNGVGESFKKAKLNLSSLRGAIIGAFAATGLSAFAGKVLDVTAAFQKYKAVLTNTLGSEKEANQVLKGITDFAAKTPFQLDELTSSFVKLANQGFKPTMNEMRKLGDIAASQGKSFDMLTEAIIDAQSGEFERLKEFGIRASKAGDKVTFSFKGVKTEADFTNKSIRDYILSLGDLQGVSGSTAAISTTLTGEISNTADSLDRFATFIGNKIAPAISIGLGAFRSLLDFFADARSGAEQLAEKGSALADSFFQQKANVDELNSSVSPMIDRYEILKNKTSLSKDEHVELDGIIKQLSERIPTAITEFDKYGNAIGISTDKAREFVDQQKAMLQVKNKEAIEENEEALRKLNIQVNELNTALNTRDKDGNIIKVKMVFDAESKRSDRFEIPLIAEEITNLQEKLKGLQQTKLGTEGILAELKGLPNEAKLAAEAAERFRKESDQAQADAEKKKQEDAKKADAAQKKAVKDFEKLQDEIKDLAEKALQDQLPKNEREVKMIEDKYAHLLERAKGHLNEIKKLEALRQVEIDTKKAEQSQKETEEQEKARQKKLELEDEVYLASLSAKDREIAAEANKWDKLILEAEAAGLDATALREAQSNAIVALAQKQNKEEVEANKEKNDKIKKQEKDLFEAKVATARAVVDIIGSVIQIAGDQGEEYANFQKALTLAQIAIDTASAISSLTKASEGNQLNSLTFGAAGTIQFVTGIARILGNIAQAKSVLTEAKIPKFAEGGATLKNGGPVNSPVLAMAGEAGPEWIAPNWMLQHPATADIIGALENIRVNKFATGGSTTGTGTFPVFTNPNRSDQASNNEMLQLLTTISSKLDKPIRAYIAYDDLTRASDDVSNIQRSAQVGK